MDAFGDVIHNLYGSTEVGSVSVATPADLRAAPATAGRPPRGTLVRLLDDDGHDVPAGANGRIFVRGPLTFSGYTDGGSKSVVDGFMHTGDTGHFDRNGLLFVDGRDDEMIVSGGENVFPHEVEDVIARHPGVVEAAVVGVPDPEFGARLKAFVVARPGVDDRRARRCATSCAPISRASRCHATSSSSTSSPATGPGRCCAASWKSADAAATAAPAGAPGCTR